jgi:hypothetical protein
MGMFEPVDTSIFNDFIHFLALKENQKKNVPT